MPSISTRWSSGSDRKFGRIAGAASGGPGCARPPRRGLKLRVVAEHVVQSADDLQLSRDRVEDMLAPIGRQRAAARRGPDQ